MADSSSVVVKAAGLITSPNELDRAEGSLTEASNVIIKRDGIIEPRRGFNLYGSALPSSTNRVKQLATYRNRILRHYSSKLAFDSDGAGTFIDFAGSFLETETGLRMKFIESNGNFYFTTSDGIKKISAKSSSGFSADTDYVVGAGAIKAVDLQGETIYTPNSQSAFLPQDSTVAYRVVWAYTDANANLVPGAPSQREIVGNPMVGLLIRDYMRSLDVLDNLANTPLTSARINDKNYVSTLGLTLNSSANDVYTNLLSLSTKLDNDIFLADQAAVAPLQITTASLNNGVVTVNFTGTVGSYLLPGSNIFLTGFNLSTRQEIQQVSFSTTPTSGNFTLVYQGEATASLAFNATNTAVQTALRGIIGLGNVVVTGSVTSGTGLTLTFPITDGNVAQITVGANTLSSGVAVTVTSTTTQDGVAVTSGSVNGGHVVVTSTSTSVTFNTTAVGALNLTSATINSNKFRVILKPNAPSTPATNQELVDMQLYYSTILTSLSDEPSAIISSADSVAVNLLDITTTSTVKLEISIPEGITSNYFFQVYRSSISQATGVSTFDDASPNDELQLVYEAYPTAAELIAKTIIIEDVTPDAFRGANLYTNASTGEGILAANEAPPFAKDINRYRNSVFYANTRTKQRISLNLIGVTQMISDYDLGITPKVTITNGLVTNTYSFVTGLQEITSITTVADISNSLNGKYFLLDSTTTKYYVWFSTGSGVDPAISGRTGIKVNIATNDTAVTVATRLRDKISTFLDSFICNRITNIVQITNFKTGVTPDAVDFNTAFSIVIVQQGRGERIQPQVTRINAIAGNLFTSVGIAEYFTINTTLNKNQFYVWFQRGANTSPNIAGKTGLEIILTGLETAAQVAQKIANVLPATSFTSSVVSNVVTVTNVQYGSAALATDNVSNVGFTITTTQVGALEVLLSPLLSPARAVEETALSFIRSINNNPDESVYGYYTSSSFDVPGQIIIEARSLSNSAPFRILGNNGKTGLSFNPDIGPEVFISSITAANPTVITTTTPHKLATGDEVVMSSTNSIEVMDGLFQVLVISPTTFSIDKRVFTAGTTGSLIKASNGVFSENEQKVNRVYYSKLQQPDSVPIVNYFDVGAQDKAILRILPLRDSLFVFKEDGLYRISGDSAPFQLNLFDNSFIVLAPDSVSVANNVIYAWTTQGIQNLSEGGASVISRNIDNIILKTQSANFTNFKAITWATGYESDNSYNVFTCLNESDTTPQIGYRYSTLTQSWTTYNLSPTCGVINSFNDKLFLGASDIPYIEQEKKTFSRLDYSDREYSTIVGNGTIVGNTVVLTSITNFAVGDGFVQDQTLTTFEFNTTLDKLDLDSGTTDTDYHTLAMLAGGNPKVSLNALATKLDADPGVNFTQFAATIENKIGVSTAISVAPVTIITSVGHELLNGRIVQFDSTNSVPLLAGPYVITVIDANRFSIPVTVKTAGTTGNWQTVDGNFDDIKICYNFTILTLNNDLGISFNNYKSINNNTIQEAIITSINTITKRLTLNIALHFLTGTAVVKKSIMTSFTYSPNTMGDPLGLKHIREATLMFERTNITTGTMSFSTDLLPELVSVSFNMSGNGIFGHSTFGSGFFGGVGNAAPFRTYIPRQCQRCRYVIIRFQHSIAGETYAITGVTITGNIGQSSRAYR